MLLSFRTDRVFEEAARSDEAFDKLLLRLRRNRRPVFVFVLVVCLIALPLVIWALMRVNHIVTSIGSGTTPSNAVSELNTLAVQAAAFVVPFLVVMGSLSVDLRHSDACIKMLILIRGRQVRQSEAEEK